MNITSKDQLIEEVNRLVEYELYDSAETLCTLYISYLLTTNNHSNNNNIINNMSKDNGRDSKQQHQQQQHHHHYQLHPQSNQQQQLPIPQIHDTNIDIQITINIIISDIYELCGDIIYKKNEIKRSLHYYRLSIQYRKSNQIFKFKNQTPLYNTIYDIKIKYKECKCLYELNEMTTAIMELETIPSKYRNLSIHLLMGKLYKLSNRKKSAISSYKSALMLSPLAIEIIEKLIQLGVDSNEIISVVDASVLSSSSSSSSSSTTSTTNQSTTTSSSSTIPTVQPSSSLPSSSLSTTKFIKNPPPLPALIPISSFSSSSFSSSSLLSSSLPPPPPLKPNPASSQYQQSQQQQLQLLQVTQQSSSSPSSSSLSVLISNGWLHTLIIALVYKSDLYNEKSLLEFQKLSLLYPKNAYLSLHVAELSILIHQNDVALSIYRQIRRHDSYIITKMNEYGRLLYSSQDSSELSHLVDDVISSLPSSYIGEYYDMM